MAVNRNRDEAEAVESTVAQFATTANRQLKAAGVDTEVMANRAGDLQKMITDEIAARPFQALAAAALVGFFLGIRR
jgi:ElaB/YqjD/DUF883 family membrane-anchored ribosome-binding protein